MGDGFKPAPVPDNEAERLREVRVFDLTGVNGKNPQLKDIIQIACAVADTPTAMAIKDFIDIYTQKSAQWIRRSVFRFGSWTGQSRPVARSVQVGKRTS